MLEAQLTLHPSFHCRQNPCSQRPGWSPASHHPRSRPRQLGRWSSPSERQRRRRWGSSHVPPLRHSQWWHQQCKRPTGRTSSTFFWTFEQISQHHQTGLLIWIRVFEVNHGLLRDFEGGIKHRCLGAFKTPKWSMAAQKKFSGDFHVIVVE